MQRPSLPDAATPYPGYVIAGRVSEAPPDRFFPDAATPYPGYVIVGRVSEAPPDRFFPDGGANALSGLRIPALPSCMTPARTKNHNKIIELY
jgi:hypothetical protein